MGVGPAVAIPAAVKAAGLEIEDIDLFELNEVCSVVSIPAFLLSCVTIVDARFICVQAFASQFVYCCNKLGLDRSKVNVNGGAIAMGHPLGATGN
jgi:acetyl-CoA acyltransferase 1